MFPSVTFATSCWKRDWRRILLDKDYLAVRQIAHHRFPFAERLLIINNLGDDLDEAIKAARAKIDEGILTRCVIADGIPPVFQLARSDFDEWQYYNALGPLTAINECTGSYLLYLTGDVYLKKPVDWISRALRCMQKHPRFKVANLTWNENDCEAKKESYRSTWNFYVARQGFSDQMFLVRRADFCAPILGEIRPDSHHYPRGDVFEKRVFSYMKNRNWERITFRRGSYTHENL